MKIMQVIVFGLVGWDCDILLGVRHPVLNLIQDCFRVSCRTLINFLF